MFSDFHEDQASALPADASKSSSVPWVNWGPSIAGEVTPCFEGGFLYRIIDSSKKIWSLYNDTFVYEMHATFIFGPDSYVEAITDISSSASASDAIHYGNRVVASFEDNELAISLVVYPMETVQFARGDKSRYRCRFDGKPLSQEYLEGERTLADVELERDKAALRERICSTADSEDVLTLCKANGLVFIDSSFPPGQFSLDMNQGLIVPSGWRRPSVYLPLNMRSQISLFQSVVTPFATRRGELQNSWLISAMAALAEYPDHIKSMFLHPVSSEETPQEEAVGAYRVWLNTDGLWHSVLVDSYLPVVGPQQRYARSANGPCEMWMSYLEKAYAKRYRSYINIASGDPLFAIRDFTGFPTSRLDVLFSQCAADPLKGEMFFLRIIQDYESGHIILLSTPGSSDLRSAHPTYQENGLLIGYTYAVLDVCVTESPAFRLLRLRNPWESATRWKGKWSADSLMWQEHPEVSAVFPEHSGKDGTFIMEWSEVLEVFVGCGIVFNHHGYVDYRIPFEFHGTVSELCLEIHVTEPTALTFILSQPDSKGTARESGNYNAIMISIAGISASTVPGSQDGSMRSCETSSISVMSSNSQLVAQEFSILSNSSLDAEIPSQGLTFLQGRDVSVMYMFLPEESPYLVVPRLLLQPSSLQKSLASPATGSSMSHRKEVRPCVLGVLSQFPFTSHGQARVLLRELPADSPVFQNYLRFANDSVDVEKTFYVKRPGFGVMERCASELK